jgi:hypothetical protein
MTVRFKRSSRFTRARDEAPEGMEELRDWAMRLSPEKKDYLFELLSEQLDEPDDDDRELQGTGARLDDPDQGQDRILRKRRQYDADGRALPALDSAPRGRRAYAPNGMNFNARYPHAAKIKILG